MPARPAFASKLSLPVRLKHNNSSNSVSATTTDPAGRRLSPQRATMSENIKPGLVLRVNVLKVRATPPRASAKLTIRPRAGTSPRRTGAVLLTR